MKTQRCKPIKLKKNSVTQKEVHILHRTVFYEEVMKCIFTLNHVVSDPSKVWYLKYGILKRTIEPKMFSKPRNLNMSMLYVLQSQAVSILKILIN